MLRRPGGLWRHPGFLKLWAGQTVSEFGSQITVLALPLTAVLALEARPGQMGILEAAQYAPHLLVTLFAGVLVDRVPRRPVLLGADLGRALLLASVPLAALLGVLGMTQLYLVGFLVGVLSVFFAVAYQSFLPSLVRREDLVEGNSKLQVSRSAASISGPGLGGALVQLLTAPVAIVVDVLSFLVSVLFLLLIRAPEPAPTRRGEPASIGAEIGEGLRLVLAHGLLRTLALFSLVYNLFRSATDGVYVLYATRELAIAPAGLGLVFAVGGLGALTGALLPGRLARRFGLGPTLVGGALVSGAASLLVPLAGGPPAVAGAVLAAAQLLEGLAFTIVQVNQLSLRQAITPDHLQGRMNASLRVIGLSTVPLGALLGGAIGERIGLWPTLAAAAVGMALASGSLLLSPVRNARGSAVAGDGDSP